MNQLKLPYSFVPCSDSIYIPRWAHQVSHDIPFTESYSGSIDVTLTNHGYLCVGGSSNSKNRNKNLISGVSWARTPDRRTIIPGSSIKGMLRNDAEIICFGKFQQFTDKHYSFRDISSTKTDYFIKYKEYRVQAAWLKLEDNGVITARTCKCAKAFNNDINKLLKLTGDRTIRNSVPGGGSNISRSAGGKIKNDNAVDKYFKAGIFFKSPQKASIGPLQRKVNNGIKEQAFFYFDLNYDCSNLKEGYIVFNNYRIENLKNKDFVNYSYYYYDIAPHDKRIEISEKVFKKFERAQSSEDTVNLIKHLKDHAHDDYGFPVWLFMDKNSNEVKEIGLCRMPRLLYNKSIDDAVNQKYHNSDYVFDLPELLFGTIKNGDFSNFSLKGRIGFSDFISSEVIPDSCFSNKTVVLQEPKTSFTDGYLVNSKDKTKPTTYHQSNSVISGWKRYKVQDTFACVNNSEFTDAQKSDVEFLTQKGKKFKGTILFHNLKKEELGALLYVIKFWDDENCYHMLGHAKPYGAGAVKLNVERIDFPSYEKNKITVNEAILAFKNEMKQTFGEEWENCTQFENLKEISKMHSDYTGKTDQVYNKLDDFRKIHQNNEHFEYETDKGCNVSVDCSVTFSNIKYNNQLGKLLCSEKQSDFDIRSQIEMKLTEEREHEKKQKLKASRSNEENHIAEFLEKYSNIVSVDGVGGTIRGEIFEIVCQICDNINKIDPELLNQFKDYLLKVNPANNKTVVENFTKVPPKKKKDKELSALYGEMKSKMNEIISHCNS